MAIVVIGGHSRNIGKTSVVCRLISALPERNWTAIKITQFGHGICSANGEACDCETNDHTIAVSEERNRESGTDSSRYLTAGAARSLWVRTRQGQLAAAMPRVRVELAKATNAVVESNSILRFLKPDLYLAVLDPSVADFKPSALRYLDRADAILISGAEEYGAQWPGVSPKLIATIPRFRIAAPNYWTGELERFVHAKLIGLAQPAAIAAG
jgi:molybdopterin-guanine dinucleotide biosynthesis protein